MSGIIVGIDEAGRGPLAGPLSVGAVTAEKGAFADLLLIGTSKCGPLKDSKQLTEACRESWYQWLCSMRKAGAISWSVVLVPAAKIDSEGMSKSLRKSVATLTRRLSIPADADLLLDGSLKAPISFIRQQTIIKGDESEPIISLASIAAKVTRDRLMKKYARDYPQYGFKRHVGYGTKMHREAIEKYGPTPLHRLTYCKNLVIW